jgi:hypothetical protein
MTPLTVLFSWRSESVILRYMNISQSFFFCNALEECRPQTQYTFMRLRKFELQKEMSEIEPLLPLNIVMRTIYRGIMSNTYE